MNVLYSKFSILSIEEQLKFILCPPTIETAKCVSKFLGIMTKTRSEIDAGLNPYDLNMGFNWKGAAEVRKTRARVRIRASA